MQTAGTQFETQTDDLTDIQTENVYGFFYHLTNILGQFPQNTRTVDRYCHRIHEINHKSNRKKLFEFSFYPYFYEVTDFINQRL
jgi:hypothetical protein